MESIIKQLRMCWELTSWQCCCVALFLFSILTMEIPCGALDYIQSWHIYIVKTFILCSLCTCICVLIASQYYYWGQWTNLKSEIWLVISHLEPISVRLFPYSSIPVTRNWKSLHNLNIVWSEPAGAIRRTARPPHIFFGLPFKFQRQGFPDTHFWKTATLDI